MIFHQKSVSILVAVGLALCITFLNKPYNGIDDYLLSIVANGLYSSENYCVFIHPILTSVVCSLHHCFPAVDFYLFFIRLFYLLTIALLANRFYMLHISQRTKLLIWGIIIPLSFVNLNYTVFTAFITACGLYLTFTHKFEYGIPDLILSLLVTAFGCMLRRNVILLGLPYLICEILFSAKELTKESIDSNIKHKHFQIVMLIFLVFSLLLVSFFVEAISPDNCYGAIYNHARTVTYDYPMKNWNDVDKTNAPNLSVHDYICLIENGIYGDTDVIDIEYLKNIIQIGTNQFDFSHTGLYNSMKRIVTSFISDMSTIPVSLVCFFLYLLVMFSNIPFVDKLKNTLVVLGSIVICFYFSFKGRLPGRVTSSVLIFCSVPLLCSLSRSNCSIQASICKKIKQSLCIVVVIAVSFGLWSISQHFLRLQQHNQLEWASTTTESNLYVQDDNDIFVWNVLDHYRKATITSTERGLLPTEDQMKHHIDYNSWTYGQPYMTNYLEHLGIPNPIKALLERPHTYLVAYDQSYVETYLQEHYDEQTKAIQIGAINSVPVWSFQH